MHETHSRRDGGMNEAPLVGDHLALDLLNTEARSNGTVIDFWRTGEDVLTWLSRCGVLGIPLNKAADLQVLFAKAVALRALAHRLIAGRKQQGVINDVCDLNVYLDAYLTAPHLVRDADHKWVLTRQAAGDPVASQVGPLAEAVAQLLAQGDFDLVKQCEHPDCILWFYDCTKAHKRRWCSMAACGNRHKAAQFRKRSSGVAA